MPKKMAHMQPDARAGEDGRDRCGASLRRLPRRSRRRQWPCSSGESHFASTTRSSRKNKMTTPSRIAGMRLEDEEPLPSGDAVGAGEVVQDEAGERAADDAGDRVAGHSRMRPCAARRCDGNQ